MLEPKISGSSIVLRGSFNPTIFQPSWLARYNLISTQEADAAQVKVVHSEVSHFETESSVIQVTKDRFAAATKASVHWVPLADLVVGTFSILEHTPVTAMGINRQMHFEVSSEE